jgi:release factor glutamine methyltransferase
MPTIAEATHAAATRLGAAAGEDARLEAEVLLAHVLGVDRAHVLAQLHETIDARAASAYQSLVDRRVGREPLAYIVGWREFYGIEFICTPDVLIPRPETEMLVDLALEEVGRRNSGVRIVDVGTGSGAVAVAVALHAPAAHVTATDASESSLSVARRNAQRSGVSDRVTFAVGDLLAGAGTFDVILANLPYVSESEWRSLEPEVRDHEPRDALVGGDTGIEAIARLIGEAPEHLTFAGVIAAEIGETQAGELLTIAHQFFPDGHAYVMKDFAGKDRMLVIRREVDGIG